MLLIYNLSSYDDSVSKGEIRSHNVFHKKLLEFGKGHKNSRRIVYQRLVPRLCTHSKELEIITSPAILRSVTKLHNIKLVS